MRDSEDFEGGGGVFCKKFYIERPKLELKVGTHKKKGDWGY